jgi:hypothetical protein
MVARLADVQQMSGAESVAVGGRAAAGAPGSAGAEIDRGSSSWRRRSWSSPTVSDVWVTPRQPRLARSNTAHTSDKQLVSPGRRPITFTRRRDSPKVRSMKLE